MSEPSVYDVKYLSPDKIKGHLLFYADKVVFEPEDENSGEIEISVSDIKDARLATEKDVSVLNVFLFGAWAQIMNAKHKMLIIDVEDELGILKHLVFEGNEMDLAVEELYDVRRMKKIGESKAVEETAEKKLKHGNWQCSKCMRINSAKARFCTRCGEARN